MSHAEEPPEADSAAVASIRAAYNDLYRGVDLSTVVGLSSEDTRALGLGRDGFTYGETSLSATSKILAASRLSAYAYRGGATIVDLGSGIGNVVAAAALLSAAGALGDDSTIRALHGVELLPSLHAVGVRAVERLHEWEAQRRAAGDTAVLPYVAVHCANLESVDLSAAGLDVDIVYMASTVFEDEVVERFTARAAASLRVGSRVVTLASALRHAAFRVEAVVPCFNSWGEEDAYVHVLEACGEEEVLEACEEEALSTSGGPISAAAEDAAAEERAEALCARVQRVYDDIEADLLAAEAAQAGVVKVASASAKRTEWTWV